MGNWIQMEKVNIRQLFFQFHVKLAISFVLVCIMVIISLQILIDNNIVTHKFSDKQIDENIEKLKNSDSSFENYLYIEIENNEIIFSNMDEYNKKNAYDYFDKGRQTKDIIYEIIQKYDRSYIIQFPKNYLFVDSRLQNDFHNPIQMLMGIGLMLFIFMYYYFSRSLYHKLDMNFNSLMYIIDKINDDNLDFNDEASDIHEFTLIKKAIVTMKQNLVNSKKEIWNQNNSMKKQIAALSHDIKVPISIIRGNSELIGNNLNSEKNKKRLMSIIRQVDRMDRFLIEFSAFAKLQCLEKIELSDINVQDFCNSIKDSVDDLCLINKRDYRFKIINLENDCYCRINQVYMMRTINNILRNALDYSEKIIIVLIQQYESNIKINVIDFGEGFNDVQIKHCKELFFSKNISRTGIEHYGIGLSFANKVVELHEGSLLIKSELEKYSMISIKLPICKY